MFRLLLISFMLVGCAAQYTYENTVSPDGTKTCKVTVTSSRDVDMGNISIGENCEAIGGAEGMSAGDLIEVLKQILLRP